MHKNAETHRVFLFSEIIGDVGGWESNAKGAAVHQSAGCFL